MEEKLTTHNYWIAAQGNINLQLDPRHPIKLWIEENIDVKKLNDCFEVGCFPGRYLTIFGNHGVELNGIDFIPETKLLRDILTADGYKCGEFACEDFTKFITERKYDCVFSLGFIEHFKNWEEMFMNHLTMVNQGGYVAIEVPNFRGFLQYIPRFLFDHTNLKRHNTHSMNMEKWEKVLLKNNFTIVNKQYFGGYDLWYESTNTSGFYLKCREFIEKILRKIKDKKYRNVKDHADFSCYMGIIAKKN